MAEQHAEPEAATASATPPPAEHADAGHADAGHADAGHADGHSASHGAGHKKKHDGGHGGGHGGSWIVTYCDMITLLIAFFICILTFASKESGKEKHAKLRDSILYGPGGSGPGGPVHRGTDQDALVWRQVLTSAHHGPHGSRIPPMYSDPLWDRNAQVLTSLEESSLATLKEGYLLRLPLVLFFDRQNELTATGQKVLRKIAASLRVLPYDIFVQVAERAEMPRALTIAKHFEQREGIEASRLGVGQRGEVAAWNPSVWFAFMPRN